MPTKTLGGFIRGFIPKALITTNNNDEFAESRFTLRNAWNTNYLSLTNEKSFACTPFRAINNSGDLKSRKPILVVDHVKHHKVFQICMA